MSAIEHRDRAKLTGTKLDGQRLSGSKHWVTDSHTRRLLVDLNCRSVGLDTDDL
jgi:hypothetical protein